MHFLPDVYITCDVCRGNRFNGDTLEVRYKGKSIAEVLNMTVNQGLDFFDNVPIIRSKLQLLFDVGLGYIKLGQSATTLSGGEAQRVKLARELGKRMTANTLYILDEPTIGLHFADIHKLLDVLMRLVDMGNTVVVIEHNLDVIKSADYVIDLGPEGGDRGGRIVAAGTPEEIAHAKESLTGRFLKEVLP
jgi:excinuclease ABC subunit A